MFVLPCSSGQVRLESRYVDPSDPDGPNLGGTRRLGVRVSQITILSNAVDLVIAAGDPGLIAGWYDIERLGPETWRWTDGSAALPWISEAGQAIVTVHCTTLADYPIRDETEGPWVQDGGRFAENDGDWRQGHQVDRLPVHRPPAYLGARSRVLQFVRKDNVNLRLNRKHQDAASHALKIYKSGAIYTFIPKNACSTMRLSLAIANCCIADASNFEWIHENNETFRANLEDLVRAPYTFVLLRDPFIRLASCFLDKIVSQGRPARRLRELVGQGLNLNEISFTDFVHLLQDAAVRGDNIHWRPQTDFLVYDRYDDYFAVEDLADAAATIQRRAGLEVVDARPLTAHGLDRYNVLSPDIDYSTAPVSEIARLRGDGDCPDPRSLYSPSTIKAVARLYAEDIQLYMVKIGRLSQFRAVHSAAVINTTV